VNFPLPPPPLQNASKEQWDQWFQALSRFVRPQASTSGDAGAVIPSGSTYHGVTGPLTAGRTLTVPPTASVPDGASLVVQDESGNAGTHNLTLQASAGDTLLGSAVINSNYGRKVLAKRGAKWFAA
jgi:hypothetical protein